MAEQDGAQCAEGQDAARHLTQLTVHTATQWLLFLIKQVGNDQRWDAAAGILSFHFVILSEDDIVVGPDAAKTAADHQVTRPPRSCVRGKTSPQIIDIAPPFCQCPITVCKMSLAKMHRFNRRDFSHQWALLPILHARSAKGKKKATPIKSRLVPTVQEAPQKLKLGADLSWRLTVGAIVHVSKALHTSTAVYSSGLRDANKKE